MPTSRSATQAAEGFSLFELMVVLAIVAALFGIGIGAFQKLHRPEQEAARAIGDVLRDARLFARAESAPASVLVRPAEGEILALGLRAAGNWHFEDAEGTGWPVSAVYPPEALVRTGAVGWGLSLGRGRDLTVLSPPPSFDSPFGFGVQVALRPESGARPMTLLERSGLWKLDLDESDVLRVTLVLQEERTGAAGARATRPSAHEFPGVRLSPERWSRLLVTFDGLRLHVSLDGARAAEDTLFSEPVRLASNPGVALTTGYAEQAYRGLLDELRVGAMLVGRREELPLEVQLEGSERVLRFDAFGRLDPAFHRTPEVVSFLYGEPERRAVLEVGLLGTVSRRDEPAAARLAEARPAAGGAGGRR